MRQRLLARLAISAITLLAISGTAQAQGGAAALADSGLVSTGGITRVMLFRVADGASMNDMNRDMRTHLVPIWEAEKQAGFIAGYSTMVNMTRVSENDWQFGITVTYENWAAMDGFRRRTNDITLAHYGSAEARSEADRARNQARVQVSNRLIWANTYAPIH